jgi:nucleotide-binding universal stress UspA family protein
MTGGLFYRIVVPTDFSRCSDEAWATARRIATATGAEVILAHVFVETHLYSEGPFSGPRTRKVFAAARNWVETELDKRIDEARASGLKARAETRTGRPHTEIVNLATDANADLIVIGTHGRDAFNRALLGSVTERVVRLAPCPVLTVREPETPGTSR